MKPSFKNYRHPRPFWLKALGDSILSIGVGTGTTSLAIVGISQEMAQQHPWLVWVGVGLNCLGVLGHWMTNFYKSYDAVLTEQEKLETQNNDN